MRGQVRTGGTRTAPRPGTAAAAGCRSPAVPQPGPKVAPRGRGPGGNLPMIAVPARRPSAHS
eukprot:6204928-Heterocapsa_arctica.AAC.1